VNRRATGQATLTLGALGVVFGDIGTSPLYTIQTAFNPSDPHPVAATRESIFGIVSLISGR
jgi:KUP system potassium uptake protein